MLEAAAHTIRNEVLRILAACDDGGSSGDEDAVQDSADSLPKGSAEWQPQREGLHDGVWQKLVLWAHGRCVTASCCKAPRTAEVVAALPDAMLEAPGRVALSLLLPGARVRPHCGPTNHRLRLHLPVLLPAGALVATGLSVAGKGQPWIRDRCLIFDDSFEHEVQLAAVDMTRPLVDIARVVLLVDLWHPDAEILGLRPLCATDPPAKSASLA